MTVKVLHVIKGLGRGGAERLLEETIASHSKGYHFDVVYFLPWKNQLVKDLEKLGCNVHLLKASNVAAMLLRLPALIRLVRKGEYQILHCHLPWSGIVGRTAGRFLGIPVVYTEHNNCLTYNRITFFFHRLHFSWFHTVIAVSGDTMQSLRLAFGPTQKVKLILNGVNTSKFEKAHLLTPSLRSDLGIPQGKFVISTVAVFREQKRLDRWLRTAREILTTREDVFFIIMGDGAMKESLLDQVRALRLDGHVLFTGLVPDPRPYLSFTDIYLMSSDFEGLPVALLEAMSMACIPVATAVGGIPDVIREGVNGILYDPGHESRAATEIDELLSNAPKRLALQAAARITVLERYSVDRMVRELEEVYATIITTEA